MAIIESDFPVDVVGESLLPPPETEWDAMNRYFDWVHKTGFWALQGAAADEQAPNQSE